MSMLTNQDLLRRVPLFSMLSDDQLHALAAPWSSVVSSVVNASSSRERNRTPVHHPFGPGARAYDRYGQRSRSHPGTLQSGDYFGEMSLIDNDVHSARSRRDQTDVLELGRTEFLRSLADSAPWPTASCAPGAALAPRRSQDRSLALMSVYGRVANVLLDAAKAARRAT